MEETNNNQTSGAPPRLIVKKIGESQAVAVTTPVPPQSIKPGVLPGKKQTARIDLQPASLASGAVSGKKKTARISLDDAGLPPGVPTAPAQETNGPQTIRLKRPPQATSQRIVPPIEQLVNSSNLASAVDASVAKKQTSRISLESALMPDEVAAKSIDDETMTIRIKRPASTVVKSDTAGAQPTMVATPPEAAATIQKNQTSKIELGHEPPAADEGQPTQRKTIKIRRPGATGGVETAAQTIPKFRGGGHPATTNGEAGAAVESAMEAAPVPVKPLSKLAIVWNVLFSLSGVAAIAILGVVIYVLAQQAFPKP